MNADIALRVTRIDIYLKRIRQDMRCGDPVQGMCDAAELAEQARRLYEDFAREKRKGSA
jgi:hypothetical protein